jgi:hypothetical protein
MSIPKKGTRKIIVDGEPFLWLIRRQATNMPADYGCGNLHVAVQHAQERPHPQCWGTNEVRPVTPSDAAQWIRQAMQFGWQPQLPGITFEARIAGLFMEKI